MQISLLPPIRITSQTGQSTTILIIIQVRIPAYLYRTISKQGTLKLFNVNYRRASITITSYHYLEENISNTTTTSYHYLEENISYTTITSYHYLEENISYTTIASYHYLEDISYTTLNYFFFLKEIRGFLEHQPLFHVVILMNKNR